MQLPVDELGCNQDLAIQSGSFFFLFPLLNGAEVVLPILIARALVCSAFIMDILVPLFHLQEGTRVLLKNRLVSLNENEACSMHVCQKNVMNGIL